VILNGVWLDVMKDCRFIVVCEWGLRGATGVGILVVAYGKQFPKCYGKCFL